MGRKRGKGTKNRAVAADFIDDMEASTDSVEVVDEFYEEEEETTDLSEAAQNDLEVFDLEESEANPSVMAPSGGFEVIMDLREWLKCPWDKI